MKDKMWECTPDAGMMRVGFFPDQVVRKMSLCRRHFTRCIRHTRPSRPSLPAAFSVAAELSQKDGLQGGSISYGCLASGRDGHAMEVEVQAAGSIVQRAGGLVPRRKGLARMSRSQPWKAC